MRDMLTSPRIIEMRHNRRVRNFRLSILFFILLITIIGAASYFSGDKHVVIENINIKGNKIIDKIDIESIIFKDISGKYFHLFARSNSFIYPHGQIYNDLISNFPRIKTLSINRDGLKSLNIEITERYGSFLFCGPSIPTNKDDIGDNCYFINSDGYIFDKAPYFSGNVYFKYYGKIEGEETDPLGKQMMNINSFHKLSGFIDGISAIGFNPISIEVGQDGINNLYLSHKSADTTPKIIFKNDNDFDLIKDNLALAMKKKEFAEEINSKYNTLLYIDLKFNNKVLYKFQ